MASTSPSNIPDEAVEAAARALAEIGGQPHNWANYRNPARAALEAAALCLKPRASLKPMIPDEAVEAAVEVLWDKEASAAEVRAALEAAAPRMLSHEREQTRLAHLDAMVNRETKREELAAAWERGVEDGYHHRPNPYRKPA